MGKPGEGGDDDDLVIELEETEEDFAPGGDEGVADYDRPPLEASTLPEGEEGEEGEGDGEQEAQRRREDVVDDVDDDTFSRIAAAEQGQREATAAAIWTRAQAEAAIAEQQQNNVKVALDTLEMRLAAARADRRRAEDAEDREARDSIDVDIKRMEKLQGELEDAQKAIPNKDAILHEGRNRAQGALDAQPSGKKIGAGIRARHPLAERWAGANPWMRTNAKANRDVLTFGQKIADEGYDPSSPAFYAELTRRMRNAHPNLKVSPLQAQKRGPQGKGANGGKLPVAGARSSAGGEQRIAGSNAVKGRDGKLHIKLNAAEQRAMMRSNLDPRNPKHQQYWAKSRMASAKQMSNVNAR
jgi:hypothetical protein